ncbi:MAG: dTMP kinase [Planctomycetota bacterium]
MEQLKGKFIVLDGPDGCGKSTQCRLLIEWLQKQGVGAEMFRDPGATDIGEAIRLILLNPQYKVMDACTELLLYMAARVQLWQEKMKPAMEQNKCVILDRWLSSTCAYQGFAGGFGIERIIKIAGDCLERVWPDLTIILNIDIETTRQRLGATLDRMEQKDSSYHKKVRQGFLNLASQQQDIEVIDASGSIEKVHENIMEVIKGAFST